MESINNAVLRQKENLQDSLNKLYVKREKFDVAKKWMENDMIKIVIGPRRSGKSVFSLMLAKDKNFAYLNLDADNLPVLPEHDNYDQLLQAMFAVYGQTKLLLFDEIQNLPNWELFVNRLQREGFNVLVTGSNAKLLSKELATHLTGRHLPIEILPFNFKEFLSAKQFIFDTSVCSSTESKGALLKHLRAYMENGGYPELVMKDFTPVEYLATLFDSVLFKDVVNRFKVRFAQKMNDLGSYLLNNAGAEFSSRRLAAILQFKSVSTVEKYLSHLEESYLIFILNRFSFKTGERLGLPKKVYVVDNGYLAAKAVQSSPDNGRLMENLVFDELLKKGQRPNFDLFYYKTRNNKEVDFVSRNGIKTTELLQVAYDVSDPAVKNREVRALLEAGTELDCGNLTVITWDHEESLAVEKQKVEFVPLWKWLLK